MIFHHHFPKRHTKDFTGDEVIESGPGFWERIWYNVLDTEEFRKMPVTLLHAGYSYWRAGRKIQRKKSDFWSIETVTAGNLFFEQNGKKYLVEAGDSFIMRKECVQSYYTGPNGYAAKRFIRIEGPLMDNLLEMLGIANLDIVPLRAYGGMIELLKQATTLFRTLKAGGEMEMALLAFKILMTIAAHTGRSAAPEGLVRSIEIMQRSLGKSIATSQLAECAEMSVPHYYRLFKEHFGKPPLDYYLQLKMERARYLLTATKLSIKEIAWNLGYTDPSYFSRSFSRITGVSAKRYRRAGVRIWV
jgi:AraC-like DNA-binding protein